ncbi:MAG: hypothetical protein NC349_07580 [Paenibacillus sp.]|nr:hypothetical protein [Paenibacillus sp.]
MKIIRFIDTDPQAVSDVDFHPDSALLLPGRPMFYPDFGGEWTAMPYMAVHVNRLGKSVGVKFASRYYDSMTLGLRFAPVSPDAIPPGFLSGMDSTITHGEWMLVEEWRALRSVESRIESAGGDDMPAVRLEIPSSVTDEVDRAIVRVSELTTLRMGDVLLLPVAGMEYLKLSPRSRIIATAADGREILNIKVV